MLVHEVIEAHAVRRPDAPAIWHQGETLTYAELIDLAVTFEARFRDAGAGPGSLVALLAPRSAASVACFLGVLRSGAAYVPIDIDYPPARVAHILGDIGSRLSLVCHDGQRPEGLGGLLGIDISSVEAAPRTSARSSRSLKQPAPNDVAYIVYTSGSTGLPRGVVIEHGSLAAVVPALVERYGMTAEDRSLHMAPLGFDTSISEILRALCAGACLYVLSAEEAKSMSFLTRLAFLRDHAITKAVLPTALLRAVRKVELPALDTLVATGEACTQELVDRWAPGRRMLNAYGSTEGTFATTVMDCEPNVVGPPPVGRPIAGTGVLLLDEDGAAEVPPGEVGEIYLAGAGVGRGYYGRDDLTAERFVALPDGMRFDRAFRTGDLGRWLPSGDLQCLGRRDHQVKVRGSRVALGEVEAALRTQPDVQDAVVTPLTTDIGTELVGHVVLASGSGVHAGRSLRERLSDVLPAAAIPMHIELIDEIPRNAHGKADRQRLIESTVE